MKGGNSPVLFYLILKGTILAQQNAMMGQEFNQSMLQQEHMQKEMEMFNHHQWMEAQERMKV